VSYSLAIANGDLVQQGSTLAIVSGIDKLKQDLQLWVLERFGGDRFHPAMGSILQDMIGGRITSNTVDRISNELWRVLDNYQRVQFKAFKENPQAFSLAEILYSIDDISVRASADRIIAVVKVRSAANTAASIVFNQGL
jgi:phage baseplate assembly protein W